jgi:hypothetical protein
LEFALEFVLAGLEVWVGDDVAEDEVEDCGAEGEERVYSLGAVLVQTDFVEVWVCGQAAETVRCLSRQVSSGVPRFWGGDGWGVVRGRGRGVRGCRGAGKCQTEPRLGDRRSRAQSTQGDTPWRYLQRETR